MEIRSNLRDKYNAFEQKYKNEIEQIKKISGYKGIGVFEYNKQRYKNKIEQIKKMDINDERVSNFSKSCMRKICGEEMLPESYRDIMGHTQEVYSRVFISSYQSQNKKTEKLDYGGLFLDKNAEITDNDLLHEFVHFFQNGQKPFEKGELGMFSYCRFKEQSAQFTALMIEFIKSKDKISFLDNFEVSGVLQTDIVTTMNCYNVYEQFKGFLKEMHNGKINEKDYLDKNGNVDVLKCYNYTTKKILNSFQEQTEIIEKILNDKTILFDKRGTIDSIKGSCDFNDYLEGDFQETDIATIENILNIEEMQGTSLYDGIKNYYLEQNDIRINIMNTHLFGHKYGSPDSEQCRTNKNNTIRNQINKIETHICESKEALGENEGSDATLHLEKYKFNLQHKLKVNKMLFEIKNTRKTKNKPKTSFLHDSISSNDYEELTRKGKEELGVDFDNALEKAKGEVERKWVVKNIKKGIVRAEIVKEIDREISKMNKGKWSERLKNEKKTSEKIM